MSFDRNLLPDPTTCNFHGDSDSIRVNVATGAWVCMSCGEKGYDVLAYEIKDGGREFVDAAKALGCWVDDALQAEPVEPLPGKSADAAPEPADWHTLDVAYLAHHFNCPTCIAVGRSTRHGLRCGTGAALWRAYVAA